MKNIFNLPVIMLATSLLSCSKFLDVKPKESVSDAQTIFDKTSAEEAVRGTYSALADGGYYGTSFQSIGYLAGGDIQWTGSQSQVQEFINHTVSPDNSTISAAWTSIYRTINRANQVISKVPEVKDASLSEAYANQLTGEAYFIRALAYFDLTRVWGGVPLILKPTLTASDNFGLPRATIEATWAQVLQDLEKADAQLPATTNRFRATQKTAWALKARYYLYRKDWLNAEAFSAKLISDAANYQLVSPYSAFFAGSVKGTVESVLEIPYNGGTETNGHAGQWLPQTSGGTRQWAPNDALVALLNNAAIGGNRSALIAKDNQNRWYGNLYRSINASSSYLMRTAELYLIRAEARAQQGNLPGALLDLNAVRVRAGLTGSTAATKEDMLLAIENERRVEFALEPHRWFDLVRTGRAGALLNVTNTAKLLLPIPSQQILLDKSLTQNTGY